jgi:hypothetical protein
MEMYLLKAKRTFPMNTDHPHTSIIPQNKANSEVVNRDIITFENFSTKKVMRKLEEELTVNT